MDKVGKDFVLGIVLDILTVKLEVFRGRTASYNNRKVQIVQHIVLLFMCSFTRIALTVVLLC